MSEDISVELVKAVIQGLGRDDWDSMAMVIQPNARRLVASTQGALYVDGKYVSGVAADIRELRPTVKEYLDSLYGPDDAIPAVLLVQFDRSSREYEITIEDADPTRWNVTPSNVDEIFETIRPKF